MIQQYEEEGIQPEILGEGFQGNEESLVIRTPSGGTMMILLKDLKVMVGMLKKLTDMILNKSIRQF